MVTSPYFNLYQNKSRQNLHEKLLIEAIKKFGMDMYYIPRQFNNFDQLYGTDTISSYETAYLMEFYIKNVEGFEGDGSFFSKFGWEIRDNAKLMLTRRTFEEDAGKLENLPRPREGDLVYFPLNDKCFMITFVNDKPFYYPYGLLPLFELDIQLFEYSSEKFNTGIPEIDALPEKLTQNQYEQAIQSVEGDPLLDAEGNLILPDDVSKLDYDPLIDNDNLQSEANTNFDWREIDPFSGRKY